MHRAYVDRGQAYYKLGNKIASQNDFDKARQLAPFESKWIDKAIAQVEGREWVDPDRVITTYEYSAPVNLYNSTNSENQQNSQSEEDAKSHCVCPKCNGTGELWAKQLATWEIDNSTDKYGNKKTIKQTGYTNQFFSICTKCFGDGKCH